MLTSSDHSPSITDESVPVPDSAFDLGLTHAVVASEQADSPSESTPPRRRRPIRSVTGPTACSSAKTDPSRSTCNTSHPTRQGVQLAARTQRQVPARAAVPPTRTGATRRHLHLPACAPRRLKPQPLPSRRGRQSPPGAMTTATNKVHSPRLGRSGQPAPKERSSPAAPAGPRTCGRSALQRCPRTPAPCPSDQVR